MWGCTHLPATHPQGMPEFAGVPREHMQILHHGLVVQDASRVGLTMRREALLRVDDARDVVAARAGTSSLCLCLAEGSPR